MVQFDGWSWEYMSLELATTKSERVFIPGRKVDLSNRQTQLNEKDSEEYRRQSTVSAAAPVANARCME